MPSDWIFLSAAEVGITRQAIDALKDVAWATPLLRKLENNGGFRTGNMPLLFEIRIAHMLHRRGYAAQYEFQAGVGASYVDFRIVGQPEWLLEIDRFLVNEFREKLINSLADDCSMNS